jgi:hypothetical protein
MKRKKKLPRDSALAARPFAAPAATPAIEHEPARLPASVSTNRAAGLTGLSRAEKQFGNWLKGACRRLTLPPLSLFVWDQTPPAG